MVINKNIEKGVCNMEKKESEKSIKLEAVRACMVEPVAKNMFWSFLVGLPVTTAFFWFYTLKPVLNDMRSNSTIVEVDRMQVEKILEDETFIWWIIGVIILVFVAQLITIMVGYSILFLAKIMRYTIQHIYVEKIQESKGELKMEKMPYIYKRKLRKLNRVIKEAQTLQDEISGLLTEDRLEVDLFLATSNESSDRETEALAYILNGECNEESIEDVIDQFEKIYQLHKSELGGE